LKTNYSQVNTGVEKTREITPQMLIIEKQRRPISKMRLREK